MRVPLLCLLVAFWAIIFVPVRLFAQGAPVVPHQIQFIGMIPDIPPGITQVIFALYKDQTGQSPLWQEVQSVEVDAAGHYSVVLGATSLNGIPAEVFQTGEAHWLGVKVEGQPEQPRTLLTSVPYAIKASDAETLGGLPASAFLRSDAEVAEALPASVSGASSKTSAIAAPAISASPSLSNVSNPTAGYVPVFTDASGDLGNSLISQVSGTSGNFVGIGTTTPSQTLDVIGNIESDRGNGLVGNSFLFPSDGSANSWTEGLGLNLYFDGTNWDTQGDGINNGGGGITSGVAGAVNYLAIPSTGGTGQIISNSNIGNYVRMTILGNGNVGIGTTSPTSPLSVKGVVQSSGLSVQGPSTFSAPLTFSGSNSAADSLANLGGVSLNPTGAQTITQPAGTSLNVNTVNAPAAIFSNSPTLADNQSPLVSGIRVTCTQSATSGSAPHACYSGLFTSTDTSAGAGNHLVGVVANVTDVSPGTATWGVFPFVAQINLAQPTEYYTSAGFRTEFAGTGTGYGTGYLQYGFQTLDGTAAQAFQAGAVCTAGSCLSQPYTASGMVNGSDGPLAAWQADQAGDMMLEPSTLSNVLLQWPNVKSASGRNYGSPSIQMLANVWNGAIQTQPKMNIFLNPSSYAANPAMSGGITMPQLGGSGSNFTIDSRSFSLVDSTGNPGNSASFSPGSLTASRTYNLPDANGTILNSGYAVMSSNLVMGARGPSNGSYPIYLESGSSPSVAQIATDVSGDLDLFPASGRNVQSIGNFVVEGGALISLVGRTGSASHPYIVDHNGFSTAAQPDYSYWWDSGVGIYHPAAGELGFAVDETQSLLLSLAGISNQNGVVIPSSATGYDFSGKVVLANGTPGPGKYVDGATGAWTPLPSPSAVTNVTASAANWPSWLVPTVTGQASSPNLEVTASPIPSSALATPSTTVNNTTCTLGASCTLPNIRTYPPCNAALDVVPCALSLTGLTASIPVTDIFSASPFPLGPYKVTATVYTSSAGTTGTVTVTISTSGVAVTSTSPPDDLTTTQGSAFTTFTEFIQPNRTSGSIDFQTAVTGAEGSPQYGLYITVE
jgi:hypothetical protein